MTDVAYGANVRIKYATFINSITKFLSLIAGLFFTIFVARRLTVIEFGVWTIIFKYISYVTPFIVVFTYWLPRTISRGINTAKTGLLLAAILGVAASFIYLVIAYGASLVFNQPFDYLVLASVIVFQLYIERCLNSIASAHAPQFTGLSNMLLKVAQAACAFLLVIVLKLGFLGAIFAVIAGRMFSIILLYYVNRTVIALSKINWGIVKDWAKKSWLPLFNSFTNTVLVLDVLIVRSIAGNEEPIAYYGVSMSLLGITAVSTYVLPALYARLLAKRDIRDVIEAFWVAFLLAIPMVIGLLVYTDSIVAIYSIKYVVASLAVRIFVFSSILQLILSFLTTTLRGLEIRDFNKCSLRKTVLFKMPLIRLFITAIYLASISIISYVFMHDSTILVFNWGILYCLRFLAIIIAYDLLLRKEFEITLPYRIMGKIIMNFLIASLGIVLIWTIYPVKPAVSIWVLLSNLTPVVVISALLYFGILYLIDYKFRLFSKKALKLLEKSLKSSLS